MENFTFNHGDEVKDRITGLRGVVVARTDWFNGCQRITIQPSKLKGDGSPQEAQAFDIEQLELVKANKVAPPAKQRTGGPQNDRVALRR